MYLRRGRGRAGHGKREKGERRRGEKRASTGGGWHGKPLFARPPAANRRPPLATNQCAPSAV